MGRLTQPSALAKLAVGIAADSQSVKTTEKRGMYTALYAFGGRSPRWQASQRQKTPNDS
jgi:hypothetical protein